MILSGGTHADVVFRAHLQSNLPLLSLLQLHPVIKAAVLAEICFENWDVNSN